MSDDAWLQREPLQSLIDALVDDAVRRYRIEPAAAREIIRDTLSASAPLRRAADKQPTAEKLRRTAAFRRAAGESRRRIYYHLRRYQQGDDLEARVAELERLEPGSPPDQLHRLARAVAAAHRSTAERMDALDEFHRQLFATVGEFRTVLDAGCGVYPLVFPLDALGSRIERYVAAETNPASVAAVAAYAGARGDGRLVAIRWDLEEGWDAVGPRGGVETFDLALLLKLVPVVDRQARRLLPLLAQAPARTWVVSGSRTSLTKRASIERRERAILHRFVAMAGREVRGEFTAGEEFVWIVR